MGREPKERIERLEKIRSWEEGVLTINFVETLPLVRAVFGERTILASDGERRAVDLDFEFDVFPVEQLDCSGDDSDIADSNLEMNLNLWIKWAAEL